MTEGYLTIAIGEKYEFLANKLKNTLQKFDPSRELFILREENLVKDNYFFKSCKTDFERYGSYPKLTIPRFTPFDKTLFLDSDMLCASNPEFVWNFFKKRNKNLDCLGSYDRNYSFKNKFEKKFKTKLFLNHGGLMYFDKTKDNTKIVKRISHIWNHISHYTCGHKLSYLNSRDDQLIYSIAKSLEKNRPANLIYHPVISFVSHDDLEFPRYKPNWYATKKMV